MYKQHHHHHWATLIHFVSVWAPRWPAKLYGYQVWSFVQNNHRILSNASCSGPMTCLTLKYILLKLPVVVLKQRFGQTLWNTGNKLEEWSLMKCKPALHNRQLGVGRALLHTSLWWNLLLSTSADSRYLKVNALSQRRLLSLAVSPSSLQLISFCHYFWVSMSAIQPREPVSPLNL